MPASRHSPCAAILLTLAATLLHALPVMAAGTVSYSGTGKADRIDFRASGRNYGIRGLEGNDTIYSGRGDDTIDAGRGVDTINPGDGDDIVRGGPDRDYFRYQVGDEDSVYGYATGADTICDFAQGDRIDVFFNDVGVTESGVDTAIDGGNFARFDTNRDGVIDGKDAHAVIRTIRTCGVAKPSLVLDVGAAFDLDPAYDLGLPGILTIYGRTSLGKGDFVTDYHRDKAH